MAVNQTVVRFIKNGISVLEIKSGLTAVPTAGYAGTFDRVVFYTPGPATNPFVVIDAIPAAGPGDPGSDTYVSVTFNTDGTVESVKLRALIRCYIAGGMDPYAVFDATLIKSATKSGWLAFERLRFGRDDAPAGFEISDLNDQTGRLPEALAATLPAVLGLRLKAGQSGATEATFVPGPLPAQPTEAYHRDPSPTWVVRFTRSVALERHDQEIALGPLRVAISADSVAAQGLDGGCNAGGSQTFGLVQTHLAFDPNRKFGMNVVGVWAVTAEGVPSAGVVAAWNDAIVTPYLASLETISAGQPLSAVPTLTVAGDPSAPACHEVAPAADSNDPLWSVVAQVNDGKAGRGPLRPDDFRPAANAAAVEVLTLRSVQPVRTDDGFNLQVNACFNAILRHDGQPFRTRLAVFSPLRQEAARHSDAPGVNQSRVESVVSGFLFSARPMFPVDSKMALPPQRVRVGALDLEFGAAPVAGVGSYAVDHLDDLAGSWSELKAGFHSGRVAAVLPGVSVSLLVRVERLTPGGEDNLPDEPFGPPAVAVAVLDVPGAPGEADTPDVIEARFHREPPVVILSNDAVSPDRFTLDLEESATGSSSQQLSMSLYVRDGGDPTTQTIAMPAPNDDGTQRIVVIDRNPFMVARVNAPAFAGVAGADGSRQVAIWSETGFGGASWELAGASDGYPLTLPPQGLGEPMESAAKEPLVVEGQAIPFALAPPAQLSIKSSPLDQSFTEASWNLRRIFGYPGEAAPGAVVESMAFEMLYGLTCQVTYPFLQLAEINARLGAVPGALPDAPGSPIQGDSVTEQATAFDLVRTRWSRLYRSLLSRLGVLEPWDADQPGTLALDSGLSYAVRTTIDPRGLTPDLGLAGSAPTSAGILSRVFFSALGGWGHQKAIFNGGLFTVISDTEMGRTSFFSVELKGRIDVFWNVAKYVQVFERTVAPSAQFSDPDPTTLKPLQEQDPLLGRPIVRLVRSYVEILEPIRSFPDFGANPTTNGFVQGIEFKTKKIAVDPSWITPATPSGSSLPTTFRLPLWQPDADPKIYPKPQVISRHAAPPKSGVQTAAHEIDKPDMLVFFTDQTPGTDPDTNKWPAVAGHDYPSVTLAKPPSGNGLADNPDDPSPVTPVDPATLTGFGAFTFPLKAGTTPTNLAFARVDSALSAAVDSVTLFRAKVTAFENTITAAAAAAENALQLSHAFGTPPDVSGMKFNQPDSLTYYFDQLTAPLSITPSAALLNRQDLTPQLKALGVRLPTSQLLDRVVPDVLDGFDFTKLLPDFAGLNLSSLLPDLKMPAGLSNNVHVTHQFDDQTQRGWVQADVDLPIAGPTTVFSAGPVQVTIQNIDFSATVRIDVGPSGSPVQNAHGQITADWYLQLGGQPIVTFVDTALTFDQTGKTKFDLSADKVRLNGVLQLISAALAAVSDPDAGFTLKLIQSNGLPVGVQAILELPLPDVAAGTTSISNIDFGAMFGLEAMPDFALSVRVHLSDETAPFALIIFILGGGGWVDAKARYLPLTGEVSTDLTLGISVGAELEIALGPIKGVIYAFLSLSAELHVDTKGGGTTLTIGVSLLLGGEVDLAGLISVSIKLLLELEYTTSPSSLIGRGTLSLKVKICWLLTISVSLTVEKRIEGLGGGGSSHALAAHFAALPPADYVATATLYLDTLE